MDTQKITHNLIRMHLLSLVASFDLLSKEYKADRITFGEWSKQYEALIENYAQKIEQEAL